MKSYRELLKEPCISANDHKGCNTKQTSAQILQSYLLVIADNAILVEVIIAYGSTIRVALDFLLKENFINIHVLAIISIRKTIEKLVQKYPKVAFTIAMEDDGFTSQGYITLVLVILVIVYMVKSCGNNENFAYEPDKWLGNKILVVKCKNKSINLYLHCTY